MAGMHPIQEKQRPAEQEEATPPAIGSLARRGLSRIDDLRETLVKVNDVLDTSNIS
jgi:hypothetical protein